MLDKEKVYVGMKVLILHNNSLGKVLEILKYGVVLDIEHAIMDTYYRYEEIKPYKELE